jgi:hypothetical protein
VKKIQSTGPVRHPYAIPVPVVNFIPLVRDKELGLRSVMDVNFFCAGSIISELGGFPVKEAKFRREMEKLRYRDIPDATFFIDHFQRFCHLFLLLRKNFFSLNIFYHVAWYSAALSNSITIIKAIFLTHTNSLRGWEGCTSVL